MNGTKDQVSPSASSNRPRRRRRLFGERRRIVPVPEVPPESATASAGSVDLPNTFQDAEAGSRPTLVPFLALGWLLDEE